jgi:PAS domain S-box-containing protein
VPTITEPEPPAPERQRSANALLEQQEWLRVILASIGDAVITADASGQVTSLNAAAESLTGWKSDEVAGVPLLEVFKIADENGHWPIESPAGRALREGVAVGLANHTLLFAKDGTKRLIEDSAAPIYNEAGEVAGVVLVFRDVTERRQHEREAKEALSYAEEIVATLREPFLVLDNGLKVKTANAAFYRAFHVSGENTVGRFIYELGNGQWDIPALRTLLERQIPEEIAVHDFEVEHDFPEIGTRSMRLNGRRFPPEGKNPTLILLAIGDVTERKRSDAALKGSELRYRRLFQTAKDGILILDADTGKIIDANPFMSGLLGYEHDEFLGQELWQIGLFQDKEESRAAYRELRAKAYIRYDHLPLKTKGGREVEVEFVSNIYPVEGHQVAQCNIRDITDRSRLERKTQEQASALADLHRRKDEFLAMLSHELRNPLSPILNAVHLLRLQGDEGLLQREARSVIERQVGQLTRLIDDLLEVSRITTGRVRLQQDRLDMRGVVERGIESARPLIARRRHELSVSLPAEPIWLYADSTRLEQVVVNLLNNAAKYTEEGGQIWLTIRQEGDEMVLRVRDTGVGIAPEVLPRVFDLFTQADRSLDRSQGGLGIGLALVQRLVEMHRGTAVAHSAGLGRGAEFIVRLPVLLSPARQSPPDLTRPADLPARGSRILVVDDNEDSAEMLAKLLARSGHVVRTAYTGPTALEVAAEWLPEVVLLDIGLPGINGYEVARRLRLIPQLAVVKIVAMTGYGQEADVRLAQEAGFDSHQVKPINFTNVLELLATMLSPPDSGT